MKAVMENILNQTSKKIVSVSWRICGVYLLMGIMAILFYISFWKEAPKIVADSPGYMEVAQDLVDWHLDHKHLRPIGYPILLVLTHSAEKPTRLLFVVQLVLHILSIGLFLIVLSRIKGISEVNLLIFIILLLLPPFVDPTAYVMTEHLSRFMLVLGIVGLLQFLKTYHWFWLILSSLSFMYAGVTHPIYITLPPIIIIALLFVRFVFPWVRLKWREIVLSFIGLIGIWGLPYVYLKTRGYMGSLVPDFSALGAAFSSKTVKVLERLPDEFAPVRKVLIEVRNYDLIHGESHTAASYMNKAAKKVAEITGLQGKELARYISKLNWILIRKAPLHFLHEVFMTMTNFWIPSTGEMASGGRAILKLIWSLIYMVIFILLWIQFIILIGITILIKSKRFIALSRIPPLETIKLRTLGYVLSWAVIIYVWFVSCVLGMGDVRYRQPVETLMVFACLLGFVIIREITSSPN